MRKELKKMKQVYLNEMNAPDDLTLLKQKIGIKLGNQITTLKKRITIY